VPVQPHDLYNLPPDLPVPEDDGAADHLPCREHDIPGAGGCTPQSCSFRDHRPELSEPYPVISDNGLALRDELGLPTFEVAGHTLYKRLALIARKGRIDT